MNNLNVNNSEIIYITVDDFGDYGKSVEQFVEKLKDEKIPVNCHVDVYDMSLVYYITTTKSYIDENGLEFLEPFYDKKTINHPEYDYDKIKSGNNYSFFDNKL